MKTLVVYYSRTGHTEQVAREIASRCRADIEEIQDAGLDRSGVWGYLRSGWQALSGACPPIRKNACNPAAYDLVVIGTPVWNWSLAAPVRTYARRHAGHFRRVAFFCTEGGSGSARAFAELRRICRIPSVASITVKERELERPRHEQPMNRFLAQLTAR